VLEEAFGGHSRARETDTKSARRKILYTTHNSLYTNDTMKLARTVFFGALFLATFVKADDDEVEVIDVDGPGLEALKADLLPKYFEEHKITFVGATMNQRVSPGGRRGLKADVDIPEGSEVFRAPVDNLISMGRLARHEDLAKALAGMDVSPTVGISVLLVYEKFKVGEASEIYGYVNSLPTNFGGVQYWGEEELKELVGSPLLSDAQGRSRATADDYAKLVKVLVEENNIMSKEEFSFENFAWAVTNVFSRSLLLNLEESGKTVPVLLPGFDEFDLTVENVSSLNLVNDTISITSFSGAKAGAPVFVNNGNKGNDNLLLNHGTFIEGNPHDSLPVNIRMSDEDPLYDVKQRMMASIGLTPGYQFRLKRSDNGTVPDGMMRSLRIQLMRSKEIDRFGVIRRGAEPISLYNEALVYRTLLMACEKMLSLYPTSIHEDDEKLKEFAANATDGELTATRPLVAILQRRMEKQILLRTKIWVFEQWSKILTEDGKMMAFMEHY
jgi:hypothetical protein